MVIDENSFFARGKLLISGEYLVLDGAKALAVPTVQGQQMKVFSLSTGQESFLDWRSFDVNNKVWFEARFFKESLGLMTTSDLKMAKSLQSVLLYCKQWQPGFLADTNSTTVETKLEFPRLWGLGTSSTLISMVARWATVNPYELLARTFGGSGYDIACAQAESPLFYSLSRENDTLPVTTPVNFNPPFANQLFFVYLEKKQNSREGMKRYIEKKKGKSLKNAIAEVSTLSEKMAAASDLKVFGDLMEAHEDVISRIIEAKKVKTRLFPDFNGWVKSLGAWGGDFILVASQELPEVVTSYFKEKGYATCLPFRKLIFNGSQKIDSDF